MLNKKFKKKYYFIIKNNPRTHSPKQNKKAVFMTTTYSKPLLQ